MHRLKTTFLNSTLSIPTLLRPTLLRLIVPIPLRECLMPRSASNSSSKPKNNDQCLVAAAAGYCGWSGGHILPQIVWWDESTIASFGDSGQLWHFNAFAFQGGSDHPLGSHLCTLERDRHHCDCFGRSFDLWAGSHACSGCWHGFHLLRCCDRESNWQATWMKLWLEEQLIRYFSALSKVLPLITWPQQSMGKCPAIGMIRDLHFLFCS